MVVQEFSATPPVEVLRMVLSMAMTLQSDPSDPIVVKQIDITRVHHHVDAKCELYVVLPKQMGLRHEKSNVGWL